MGSDPAQASAEKGRQLVMLAAQGLVQEVQAFSREAMPG
jgi:creatinine amidohydrolase/Fe(II)-dependent formamide hydrolase-like protein